MNQLLATLASPDPRLTAAQLRHTQSELDTFAAQRSFLRARDSLRASWQQLCRSPTRRLACRERGPLCAPSERRDASRGLLRLQSSWASLGEPTSHGYRSRSLGTSPELSYTAHSSASGRYISTKLFPSALEFLSTSARGTSCPPWRTRVPFLAAQKDYAPFGPAAAVSCGVYAAHSASGQRYDALARGEHELKHFGLAIPLTIPW